MKSAKGGACAALSRRPNHAAHSAESDGMVDPRPCRCRRNRFCYVMRNGRAIDPLHPARHGLELLPLVIVGLFVGLVGGMFGVGGGIILIPALNEVLGPNQHLYQSTAMIVNLFVAVPAVYQHHCVRAVEVATVLRILPLAVVSVVIGVAVSELGLFAGEGEAYLRGLFGLFLFACAAYDLYRMWRKPGAAGTATVGAVARRRWISLAAVALPTGFASGLLGVGGGILAVPLQRRFLHTPIRTAIANSAAIIVATSFVGALAKNHAVLSDVGSSREPMLLACVLIPTAVVGSLVGSRFTHRVPEQIVHGAFDFLLVLAAVRLTCSAVQSLP